MSKGIYTYYDSKKGKIVYVGKDSNINKSVRHKAHMYYRNQQINRVIQDNPGRYYYDVLLEEEDIDDDVLNALEMYYINIYDTYENGHNYTPGGDGQPSGEKHPMYGKGYKVAGEKNSMYGRTGEKNPMYGKGYKVAGEKNGMYGRTGEKHPMYGRTGEKHPMYKKEARVIRNGKNHNGKINYGLKYQGKILKVSIFKDKLEAEAERINKGINNKVQCSLDDF